MYEETFKGIRYVAKVPTLVVQLDDPPKERWENVIKQCDTRRFDYKKQIAEVRNHVDSLLEGLPVDMRSTSPSLLGRFLRQCALLFLAVACRLFFAYSEDVIALAECCQVPIGELFVANILYEVLGGCTSFVCADKDDPQRRPLLGRTLDWPFVELDRYTAQFEWRDEGGVVFESVGWLGYVGVMTGCRPGALAVALNARYPDTKPYALAKALSYLFCPSRDYANGEQVDYYALQITGAMNRLGGALTGGGWISGSIIRTVLQAKDVDFNNAVELLSQKKLLTPSYFTIAGSLPGEGMIVTRDLVAGPAAQTQRRLHASCGYVVQTNSDFTELKEVAGGKPPQDLNSVERHDVCCAQIARNSDSGVRQPCLTQHAAACILASSMNKGCGVRMKMTLYFSIMVPHRSKETVVSARPTRRVGP